MKLILGLRHKKVNKNAQAIDGNSNSSFRYGTSGMNDGQIVLKLSTVTTPLPAPKLCIYGGATRARTVVRISRGTFVSNSEYDAELDCNKPKLV